MHLPWKTDNYLNDVLQVIDNRECVPEQKGYRKSNTRILKDMEWIKYWNIIWKGNSTRINVFVLNRGESIGK